MYTYDKIGAFDHELGFGFDEKTNDYKVVRIVDRLDMSGSPLEVEIYSLSTGILRKASHLASKLGVRIFERTFCGRDCQVYLNGAVHWIGVNKNQNSCMVIAFLLGEELFCCFEPPADIEPDFFWMRKLRPIVFQGDLSLIHYIETRCIVWVMKDYGASSSWSKHLDIDLSEQVQRVIGIRNKGGLLIEISGGLYSYDPEAVNGKKFNFLDERDLLDWEIFQDVPPGYVPHYKLDEAASNAQRRVFVLQYVPISEAGDGMDLVFHFSERVRNYDPEAAPKELGIRSKTRDFFKFSFHCERHVESLVLLGSVNCAEMRQVESKESESESESKRLLEEGTSVVDLTDDEM